MLKKLGFLGFVLAVSSMLAPSIAEAAYVRHAIYYPRGYYYHGGRWRAYRGFGHPYRGGFYDRWGHWHRY
jgi:hypothetical protein